jgi:hypothetical protein
MPPARHVGLGVFGAAYEETFRNDPHASGSVDRVLMERMVRLCSETVDHLYGEFTPLEVKVEAGSRPALEDWVAGFTKGAGSIEKAVDALAAFTAGLKERVKGETPDEMRFGGTEEEIALRGSDWCTDVARVGCAIYQVSGCPCRIVYLADPDLRNHGHAIVEVHRGVWGAVDTSTGVVYRKPDGAPASTWELMQDEALVGRHASRKAAYTNPGQFGAAAISNYFVWEAGEYDFSVTPLNPYTRALLQG